MWWIRTSTLLKRFGFSKQLDVFQHQPGPCILVPGIENGSEDAQASEEGMLFVTSGLQNFFDINDPIFENVKGQIFIVDTNQEKSKATALEITGNLDLASFNPHGLSLWKDVELGELFVYVVNHFGPHDTVEQFSYDPKENALQHLKTFADPNMILVNDLHVVGKDRFYFTNMNSYRSLAMMTLQYFWPLGFGSVGLYDGSRAVLVDTGLLVPNGINGSPDNKYLYVAHMALMSLNVYRINQDGLISIHDVVPLYTAIDNIEVQPDTGEIYLGCHPSMSRTDKLFSDPQNSMAPSQVLRLKMSDGHVTDTEEMLSLNGTLLYGSSVAVYANRRLYVGSVTHKLLQCDVLHMS